MDKQKNQFGTSLFGYNKKKVNEYIYQNITLLSEENASLKTKNSEMSGELHKLRAMQDELISGKNTIASAILTAEEMAKQIIRDATLEAEMSVADIMKGMEEAKKRFEIQKIEMNAFKEEIIGVLAKTAENIDDITKLQSLETLLEQKSAIGSHILEIVEGA